MWILFNLCYSLLYVGNGVSTLDHLDIFGNVGSGDLRSQTRFLALGWSFHWSYDLLTGHKGGRHLKE